NQIHIFKEGLMTVMVTQTYHILLKLKGKEGFVVRCLELPGCLSEGQTKEEALKNIHDAIRLYLDDIKKEVKRKKARPIKVNV
ncbi:MAG TPA: type II toxin-antitoxin system HicB family antitoxin, partial [Nitrososphaerales archaeon]|nr:type II toxin-antitoxin system HicB family antitoxin [Nitrososphaerales archaeon]